MAAGDILPFASEHGGHNRTWTKQPANAGGAITATYNRGNWVTDAGTGIIDEHANGTVDVDPGLDFISADDANANIGRIGDARYVAPPNILVKGDAVYSLDEQVEFVTRNVYATSDVNIGPAGTNATTIAVGDEVGGWVTVAQVHGLDVDQTTNLVVTRLLDINGRDTFLTGAALDKVVFHLQHADPA